MFRADTSSCGVFSPLFLLAFFLLFSVSPSLADLHQHPVPLLTGIDSSKCLACHQDKATGKYVHTAITMGCTVCHAVANVKGATYVTLSSPSNQLCFSCHKQSTDSVEHPPYKEGNCDFCHSPHASNFKAHLFAAPQDVCMACHVRNLMKVDRKAHTLTLPWGIVIPFREMDSWFYLNLDKTHKFNHPVEGHPVSGPNSALGKNAPPVTCLSCHEPHHSTVANLIPAKYKDSTSLCVSCHAFPS